VCAKSLKSCESFREMIDLIDEEKLSSKVALGDLLATGLLRGGS
jgi:hypothetical protein